METHPFRCGEERLFHHVYCIAALRRKGSLPEERMSARLDMEEMVIGATK